MPLSVKKEDILKVIGLKHYKDLFAAAKVETEPDKVAVVQTFRTKFNAASLPNNEEKDWVQLVTDAIGFTKKSLADSFDWLSAFRKDLSTANTARFVQIVKTLGASAPLLIATFGASANMETLKAIAAAYGASLASWFKVLPDKPTVDLVLSWASKLKGASMAPADVRAFWTRMDGIDRPTMWSLIEGCPDLVVKAWQHAALLPALHDFWMKKMDAALQKDRIGDLMQFVYEGAFWSNKPEKVNAIALEICAQNNIQWLRLFNVGKLLEVRKTLKHKADFNRIFLETAGRLSAKHPTGTADNFGTWLCGNCHYIAHLHHHGITDNAILAMFLNALKPREMITCTWFKRQKPVFSGDDDFVVRVENVHGGLIARRSHLATRHLYQHFNFAEIKDRNSFHPHSTSLAQLVDIAKGMKLANRNSGVQTLGLYCVCVGDHQQAEKRLLVSLYPVIPNSHRDYYTKSELENIEKVLTHLGNCQELDFPA
jgi:hypothetical protein